MNRKRSALLLSAWVLGMWCLSEQFQRLVLAQEQEQREPRVGPPEEIEVLTRGPVHEAFAQPVIFDPRPGMVVKQAPPDTIEEIPPDQKPVGDNVVWIPGYWSWNDGRNRFLWVSGIWRRIPQGMEWVPGYWAETDEGHQWVSGFWKQLDVEAAYLPPPPQTLEQGPVGKPPSNDSVWAPGTWMWSGARYAWRPGYYVPCNPDWTWVPASYVWTPAGYVFVDGYWDYALTRRGVVFAPVDFNTPIYTAANYSFSPTVVINLGMFQTHFFVRPLYSHYYFGDYYAANYFQSGFYPWFSFHMSRYGYDPIYAYSNWNNGRTDPTWSQQVRADYRYRREHEEARPAHTFAAMMSAPDQTAKLGSSALMATSLAALANHPESPTKFEALPEDRRQALTKDAQALHQFRTTRKHTEAKLVAEAPKSEHLEPRKAELPKSPLAADQNDKPRAGHVPPAKPEVPKVTSAKPSEATPKLDKPADQLPSKPGGRQPPKVDSKTEKPRVEPPKVEPKPPVQPKVEPKPERPRVEPPKVEPKPPVQPKVEPKPERPRVEPPKPPAAPKVEPNKPDKPRGGRPEKD